MAGCKLFYRDVEQTKAIAMTRGATRENGKLMLVLDDDKVSQVLLMKERGDDPTGLLFDVADEFLPIARSSEPRPSPPHMTHFSDP